MKILVLLAAFVFSRTFTGAQAVTFTTDTASGVGYPTHDGNGIVGNH